MKNILLAVYKKYNQFFIRPRSINNNSSKYHPVDHTLLKEYNLSRPFGPRNKICFAPYKSMYFTKNGTAIACCHNQKKLGTLQNSTIKEIWQGLPYNTIRDHIYHNDLSYGCTVCHQNLKEKNFNIIPSQQYDHLLTLNRHYPAEIGFELNNTCNLQCIMCSSENSSCHPTKEVVNKYNYEDDFVGQLEEFIPYLKNTRFFGGEPFLIEIYYKIWEKIIQINNKCKIAIQTNGTLLTDRIKNILYKGNFDISISLDSVYKENFESIRKNAKFEEIMQNIDYFGDYCKSKNSILNIAICPMKQNWHELPEIFEFCNKNNYSISINTVIFPPYCSLWNESNKKLEEIIFFLEKHTSEPKNEIQKKNLNKYIDLINKLKYWKINVEEREKKSTDINENNLKNLFLEKISAYIEKNHALSIQKRNIQIEKIKNDLDEVLTNLNNTQQKINALLNIIELPVEIIFNEMSNGNIQKLITRFNQASVT